MLARDEKHALFQKLAVEIIEEADGYSIEVPRDGDNDYVLIPQYAVDAMREKSRAYDEMMTTPEEADAAREDARNTLRALQDTDTKGGDI